MNSARNTIYAGKQQLLGCNIVPGMNLEDIIVVLSKALELVRSGQSLEGIKLADYGITCPEEESSLIELLFEAILKQQQQLSQRLSQISNFNNNVKESVGTITDEKVKVTATSQQSKFLQDAISGTPGRVKTVNDTILITGLIPIGARMLISPARGGDFDATGKGKVGTDVEGWAIRNGNNGLDNAFGRIPMYDSRLVAGQKAGSNTITITKDNIAGFTLTVEGKINDALDNTSIKPKVPVGQKHKCFGSNQCQDVYTPPDLGTPVKVTGDALPLQHSHSHTLTAKHTNTQPTPISIVPEHIKELPIEYIGV
jgi:hypothetical protein